jgi:hypothetical protein
MKEILGRFVQIFNVVLEKGTLTFKIVRIAQASVSHLQSPNAHDFMNETESYHQYLPEPRG